MSNIRYIELNEGQKTVIMKLNAFLKSDAQTFALNGFAGTGKTTIVNRFILDLDSSVPVVMTAPTHKAVHVLDSMRAQCGLPCECQTLQSLLRGSMDEAYSQKQIEYAGVEDDVFERGLIIIDEASMVDSKMWSSIQRFLRSNRKVKVLFVGDGFQLPPVGEKKLTLVFAASEERCYLTDIVRQGLDNPILLLTKEIRSALTEKRGIRFDPGWQLPGGKGVLVYDRETFSAKMRQCFSKPEYLSDNAKYRTIAYTNAAVNGWLDVIRKVMFGEQPDRYVVGERVAALTPWFTPHSAQGKRKIIVNTDQEGVIKNIERQYHADRQYESVLVDKLTVGLDREYGEEVSVFAVAPDGMEAFNQLRAPIIDACEKKMAESDEGKLYELRNPAWVPYHNFLKAFANMRCTDATKEVTDDNIRPAHALTAFKSQGSTFRSVFVDARDIMGMRNKDLAYRAFYVAVSRAQFGVCILDPRTKN